jgi:UDP-N-acetylglucosamine:LPS N-acetylglucosamine transferase
VEKLTEIGAATLFEIVVATYRSGVTEAQAVVDKVRVDKKPRLLAVSSGGGHWVQLLRLRSAFAGWDVSYASTFASQAKDLIGAPIYVVPDSSRFAKSTLPKVGWMALTIVLKVRPKAIVTTGSMPALFFLLAGRLIGSKTLWIDSIANSGRLSTSGRMARHIAHQVVSQWPDVAKAEGVDYWGSVL